MEFLVFQLFGPWSAWGGIAVGEVRASEDHPGRSALLGLLAGALGLPRTDDEGHSRLNQALVFGVEMFSSGRSTWDYHTVQSRKPPAREKVGPRTRGQDLAMIGDVKALITQREYREDAWYRVVVVRQSDGAPTLEKLAAALQRPAFIPFLGRKSCPTALPFNPQIVSADDAPTALAAVSVRLPGNMRPPNGNGSGTFFWESALPVGALDAAQSVLRRDDPVSRRRWQYDERIEFRAKLPVIPDTIGEGS